jgi:hypothetical protein
VRGFLIEYQILYRVKDSIARGKTKGFIKTKSFERMGGWVDGRMGLIEYKKLYRVKDSIARGKTKGFIRKVFRADGWMGGWAEGWARGEYRF